MGVNYVFRYSWSWDSNLSQARLKISASVGGDVQYSPMSI